MPFPALFILYRSWKSRRWKFKHVNLNPGVSFSSISGYSEKDQVRSAGRRHCHSIVHLVLYWPLFWARCWAGTGDWIVSYEGLLAPKELSLIERQIHRHRSTVSTGCCRECYPVGVGIGSCPGKLPRKSDVWDRGESGQGAWDGLYQWGVQFMGLEHGHRVPGGWRELSPMCQVGEFMEWSRASWAVGSESWPCLSIWVASDNYLLSLFLNSLLLEVTIWQHLPHTLVRCVVTWKALSTGPVVVRASGLAVVRQEPDREGSWEPQERVWIRSWRNCEHRKVLSRRVIWLASLQKINLTAEQVRDWEGKKLELRRALGGRDDRDLKQGGGRGWRGEWMNWR